MDKKNIEAIYPLTSMQQVLLLHAIQHPKQDSGFLQIKFDIRGKVDVIALKQAWQSLFNRHQVLRTAIHWDDLDQPLQVVLRQVTPIWQQQQLTSEELSKWYLEDQQQELSLNQAPVIRLTLIQQAADQYHFVCTCHHILLDGWSAYLMIAELFQLYQNGKLPVAFKYQQYINWIQQQPLEPAKIFWQQQLKGLSKTIAWPIKVANAEPVYVSQTQTLNYSLTKQLQQLCSQEKITLNTFLEGIWSLLLCAYSHEPNIVFGFTLSGRTAPLAGIERAVGMFINVLPLHLKINQQEQLLPWLQSIAAQQIKISNYEYVTLSQINTWSVTDVRSLFVFENYGQADLLFSNDDLSISNFQSGLTTTYPLTIAIQPGEQLIFNIISDTNYLSAEQVNKLLEDWQKLLTESILQPQQQLFTLLEQIAAMPLPQTDKLDLQLSQETFIAPKDKLEIQLSLIWEEVLGVQDISIKDNFFDLGGNSLLAVRLFAEIEKIFDQNIPLTLLFQAPTIEQLSEIIRQKGWSMPWSSLVAIQSAGSKPPLFCVPAAASTALTFTNLARNLGMEQPVYGLQPLGFEEGQVPHNRVEDMVAYYISEIRSFQPQGPYYLGGMCFGGNIAFEMAQQLQTQGCTVALLVLFDPSSPYHVATPPPFKNTFEKMANYIRRTVYHFKQGHLFYSLMDFFVYRRHWWIKMRNKRIIIPQQHRVQYVMRSHNIARMNYVPQVYSGKIIVFQSSQYHALEKKGEGSWAGHWSDLASEEFVRHVIEGSHVEIFGEPRIQILAEKLKANLDDTQQDLLNIHQP